MRSIKIKRKMNLLKRCLLLCGCFYCCAMSDAIGNLCMSNYSVLIVLDKDTNGTVKYGTPQVDDMNWRVDVNYDTLATMHGTQRYIRGIVSCSDFAGSGKEYEVNTSGVVMAGDKSGGNCWCSMVRPATTYPMFVRSYGDVEACSAGCARLCAESIIKSYNFRDKFFEAVW